MQLPAKLPATISLLPVASNILVIFRKQTLNTLCNQHILQRSGTVKRLPVLIQPTNRLYLLSSRRFVTHHCKPKMTSLTYLNQDTAQKIDKELFEDYKFSVDQLMELAGLAVATATAKAYPRETSRNENVLVIVGPGNNGGDGLVAARHLKLFGYMPSVYYPKRTDKELYTNLVTQCTKMGIEFLDSLPSKTDNFGIVIDALFGFSFKPPVREELQPAMKFLLETNSPICSLDVPSGWPVDGFPDENTQSLADGEFIQPDCLVSLMAPKICSKQFNGAHHWLGGRFVPDAVIKKYKLLLAEFPATDIVVNLRETESSARK